MTKTSEYAVEKDESRTFTTIISMVTIVLYPCLYIYFINAERVNIQDVLKMVGLFSLNALLVYGIAFFFMCNKSKAGLLTNITMLFILLFGYIEKELDLLFPQLYYWHILMLVFTLLVVLGTVIKDKISAGIAEKINTVLLTVFSVLIIFNGINAAPVIIKSFTIDSDESDPEIQTGNSDVSFNVYFFVFDEYGGLYNLERYCGYDNTPFYDSLEALGFNVSKDSRNLTISTVIEVSTLLNLERISDDENYSYKAGIQALRDPKLFILFKEKGYKVNLISDQEFVPTSSSTIDYFYTSNTKFETVEKLIINNSVYYPVLMKTKDTRITEINNMFLYAQKSPEIQSTKLFTFGYFMLPHLPWVVDEFGNSINEIDRTNYRNSDVYLGQLKYTSAKILDTVNSIILADPNAIIILQSDHGYRQPAHLQAWYGETITDIDYETQFQTNILNAVYYKGETIDIDSLSGLDTLNIVINKLFKTNN